MTVEKAIDSMYKDTLKKEKIIPVAQAEIQDIMSQSPLKIKIHIEVLPEVEIQDAYKKIKLKKQQVDVSEDEVQAALDDIQTRFTHFHEDTDPKTEAQM